MSFHQAQLSTPLIPLNPRVVLIPLVGDMDEKRARRMLEALLRGLERTRAPVAIIDITGVSNVDARVARTLVRLGTDLTGLHTRKTLQEGIDFALEYLNG